VQNSTDSNVITTKDILDLRRNIYNTKRNILPIFPVSQNKVHSMLLTMNIKTHTGEPFILSNDSDKNIIIFSCKTNIDFLCKSETIYLDGTFDYCPKLFTQLFTLHGYFNNNYVSLVFSLLPNKTKQTYTHFF